MSVAGKAVGDDTPARAYQPVSSIDPDTGAISAAASAAGQDAMQAAIGSVDDAAWSGTGDGTVIAILKAIAANTAP